MKKYRTVVSLKDVGEKVPTVTERQLDEVMGFLKPQLGEISAFEDSLLERARQRKRESEEE